MTRNSLFFTELKECSVVHVTYGGGVKGKVLGKGNINRSNTPVLNDVRLVEGLSRNLINISLLCDQRFVVNFSKENCKVLSQDKCIVVTGTRLSDNYYHWDNDLKNLVCNLSKSVKALL